MTLSPSDWELLHRELDGATTASESAKLQERLAREPELEASRRALRGLGRTLGEMELSEVPADLSGDVMWQVRQRARARVPQEGFFAGVLARLVQRPALALASSLAVGLVAGVLLTSPSGPGRIDEGSVAGTARLPGQAPELPVIDEVSLREGDLQAVVRTRRGQDMALAELEIEGSMPVDFTVEVDGNTLRPRGFECTGGEPAAGGTVDAGRVRVHEARAGRCVVSLAVLGANPGPIVVRLEAGPAQAEASLRVGTSAE